MSLGGADTVDGTGVRRVRKLATRERVLTAARDLFEEVGFEDATIRMIAGRAGVATGSVFTTFASKLDILSEVVQQRLDRLYEELETVVPRLRGSTVDRLCSIMAVHYDFQMKRPRLFAAYIAANFEWAEPGQPVVNFGRNSKLRGVLRATLEEGIGKGEVSPDSDLDLAIDVIIACYGFNYREAAQRGFDTEALIGLMDRQIGLIYAGLKP